MRVFSAPLYTKPDREALQQINRSIAHWHTHRHIKRKQYLRRSLRSLGGDNYQNSTVRWKYKVEEVTTFEIFL